MDRCDFCSIMTCLKNHISESNQMSQPEFLYEIFSDFMDSQEIEDFSLDNGLVCRWMTGQAKISPKISSYYAKPSKQELLAETMEQNLLPLMADSRQAIQDIYTLFPGIKMAGRKAGKDSLRKYPFHRKTIGTAPRRNDHHSLLSVP